MAKHTVTALSAALLLAFGAQAKPLIDESGAYVFSQPDVTIQTAKLKLTDIALEAGETLNSFHLGDTARWYAEPTRSGESTHIVVKVLSDEPISTSLLLSTDRRTYSIDLLASGTHMKRVRFEFPKPAAAPVLVKPASVTAEKAAEPKPEPVEYEITGDSPPWRPVKAHASERQTFIEVPSAMSTSAAPVLLVLDKEGGLFSSEEVSLTNYRLQDRTFIVDGLPESILLIAGETRVTVRRLSK